MKIFEKNNKKTFLLFCENENICFSKKINKNTYKNDLISHPHMSSSKKKLFKFHPRFRNLLHFFPIQ